MLNPSYSELMNRLNSDIDFDNKITSRYTIVIAAAKRARQIINGAPCENKGATTDKAVSIAVNEMNKGLIKIFPAGLPVVDEYDKNKNDIQEKPASDDYSKIDYKINKKSDDDSSNFDDTFDDGVFDDEFDDELLDVSDEQLE